MAAMELRHLRYFVVAAEQEHFHRAAELLHIVQPALSRQIRLLEEELGVTLFERRSHGVKLSQAGRVFLEGATKILDEVEVLAARAKRAHAGQLGLLRLGFGGVGMRTWGIPQAIKAFRTQYPDVELKLTIAQSRAQLEGLRSDKLDAGLMFDRPKDDPELDHLLVQHHRLYVVMPKTHPLASNQRIRMAQLKHQTFVTLPRSSQPIAYDRLMAALYGAGASPVTLQEVNDEETILHLVSAGMGIGFRLSAYRANLPDDVVAREVEDYELPMPLELVWKRTNQSGPLERFIEIVQAQLRQRDETAVAP